MLSASLVQSTMGGLDWKLGLLLHELSFGGMVIVYVEPHVPGFGMLEMVWLRQQRW